MGPDGEKSILAQVSVVNESGNTVYTSYAAATRRVTDYRTHVSGILPKHIENAPSFAQVQADVRELIKDKVVVGRVLHYGIQAPVNHTAVQMACFVRRKDSTLVSTLNFVTSPTGFDRVKVVSTLGTGRPIRHFFTTQGPESRSTRPLLSST